MPSIGHDFNNKIYQHSNVAHQTFTIIKNHHVI